MATTCRTLVIVPTFNERENLPVLAERLMRQPDSVELLVVDDSSPDGTGELADELAAGDPRVHVLHRPEKDGLGNAYRMGFHWALERDYQFVFQMDGDLSHDPEDIPRFLEAARGADLVVGTRYKGGVRVLNWPLRRLVLSMGAASYVRLVTGMPLSDPTGGFKCFPRETLASLDMGSVRSNGYSFLIETSHKVWRQGLRIEEVPIVFTERSHGRSKLSPSVMWEAVWIVWRMWAQNGLRRSPRRSP
jgi:dolichol-phosphate mannosyltransferase